MTKTPLNPLLPAMLPQSHRDHPHPECWRPHRPPHRPHRREPGPGSPYMLVAAVGHVGGCLVKNATRFARQQACSPERIYGYAWDIFYALMRRARSCGWSSPEFSTATRGGIPASHRDGLMQTIETRALYRPSPPRLRSSHVFSMCSMGDGGEGCRQRTGADHPDGAGGDFRGVIATLRCSRG